MRQSEVSAGIFLVNLKAEKARCTLQEVPVPLGLLGPWGAVGGFGCPPQVTDGWTFPLKERRTHTGKSTSNPRLLVKEDIIKGNTPTKARRKDRKGKKGGNRDRLIASSSYSPEPGAKCP